MGGSRDEMRAACVVRGVTMSLDPQTLALVRIAVATATGDETTLRDRMIAARAVHVPPQWVDELLLQSFLNVGYPLALVAFGVWRSVAGPVLDSERGESIAHPERELWTLAAIAMQNAPRQLHAHLRGALNTGSSRDEVDEVIAIVEVDLTKERALKLWEMWADVRERSL